MEKLTVSQGLRRAKKLKGLLAEAQTRAEQSSCWAAGKKPVFSFEAERESRAKHQQEIVRIESAIAVANATNSVEFEGRTIRLAEAIRTLQEFKADLAWLPRLQLKTGVEETSEYDYDEATGRNVRKPKSVTYEAALTEPARIADVQKLRDRFEALNDALETANHRTLLDLS